jgi:competence protein ComGC
MFQLIVAVIAIALVIALTLASIFYGGEAFTRSSLKANVAAMVNQAQQISGAHTLYKTDYSASAPNLNELKVQGYLAEVPTAPKIALIDTNGDVAAWDYRPADKGVYLTLGAETAETCKAVEQNGAGHCQKGGNEIAYGDIVQGDDIEFAFPL